MGVHGLWRLIEPSGKPVPLETLENKILAVDISIWLHQAIKGFKDGKGSSVPNAHLLGIYHRVCKLLYFKIKPVFVFDGGVPALKRQTIAKRNQLKSHNATEAERIRKHLLGVVLKHSAVSKVLSEKTKASLASDAKKPSRDDMFILPTPDPDSLISSSSEEDEEVSTSETDSSPSKQWDLHTIDPRSKEFDALPIEMKHEILTELIATRKQNSWGRLHELPKQSDDFSSYQMKRLLKRQSVQAALDEISKEMGGNSLSLAELETLLQDQGVLKKNEAVGKRIASDNTTRFLYIRDIKDALEKAKLQEAHKDTEEKQKSRADIEEEKDLQKAITLSLLEEPSTSSKGSSCEKQRVSFSESFLDDNFGSDSSDTEVESHIKAKLKSAGIYMMETSGLTRHEIQRIIGEESKVEDKRCLKGKEKVEDMYEDHKNNYNNNQFINQEPMQNKIENKTKSANQEDIVEREDDDEELQKAIALSLEDDTCLNDDVMKSTEIMLHHASLDQQIKIKVESLITSEVKVAIGQIGEVVTSEKSDLDTVVTKMSDKNIQNTIKLCINDKSDMQEKNSKSVVNQSGKNYAPLAIKEAGDENEVELILESGESDEDDFLDVTETEPHTIEVQIDPSKPLEEDLFGDIFSNDKKDVEPLKLIVNKTEISQEDGLFKNTSETSKSDKHKTDEKEQKNDTSISNKLEQFTVNDSEKSEVNITSNIDKISVNQKETILNNNEPKLSIQDLQQMRNNLEQQKEDLQIEKSVKERQAVNISDQMYQEAQELLELFGVPYIIAPMEAEAQCAFLDAIELTDGTITDDSDIWLFGGKTVYKNFFNQSKYVMEFRAENIKHHFKLTREQMILLALLVGSDYTIGVSGVGPVTALEILSTFPPASPSKEFTLTHNQLLSGLKEFKSWFSKGRSAGPGRSSLKNKLRNINFTDNFPCPQVVKAYLEPEVETSKEEFSWSKPDIIGLTVYAKEKFSWSSKKTEEILSPVIKRMEEYHIQKSIKDYFKTKFKAPLGNAKEKMSKRVKTAVDRIGKTPEELLAEEMELLEKEKKKTLKKTHTESGSTKKMTQKSKADQNDKKKSGSDERRGGNKTKKSTTIGKKRQQNEVGETSNPTKKRKNGKSGQDVVQPVSTVSDKNEAKEKDGEYSSINQEYSVPKISEENEIKSLENLATEIRQRRRIRNESDTKKQDIKKKKQAIKTLGVIPEDLKEDAEIQDLIATMSASTRKVEQINKEMEEKLSKLEAQQQQFRAKLVSSSEHKSKEAAASTRMRGLHSNEVIHQKVKENKDLLKNKMKAIEVFRKTKLGHVKKNPRKRKMPKEDAELSEDSDCVL